MVTRGERAGGRAKWVKGVNCIVTNGNYIFGGEHIIGYTEVDIECRPHETYNVILKPQEITILKQ